MEKLCVLFNSPARVAHGVLPAATSTVSARLSYRVKKTANDVTPWVIEGVINWDQDEPVELPEGFLGFRATVKFTAADRNVARVFTSPSVYGPLSVSLDAQSRTLVLRPLQVE